MTSGSSVSIVMVEMLNSVVCVSICTRPGDSVIQCSFVVSVGFSGLGVVAWGMGWGGGAYCSTVFSRGRQSVVPMVNVVVVLKVVTTSLLVVGFIDCTRPNLIEPSAIVVGRLVWGIRLFTSVR